jgi:hypothetical protein
MPAGNPVDQRVERALDFLQKTQNPDGSWPRTYAGYEGAVTALAVMAFLAAGHVPGEGRYGPTVEKGVRFILASQQPNGLMAAPAVPMYYHGIATLTLAEVAGMTDGKLGRQVRQALEKAVPVILQAQRMTGPHRGGWRYQVAGNDADLSVTGWQLMALRAARNLGCDVPAERIELAMEYLINCREPQTGGFRYALGAHVTPSCTAVGVLGLELSGRRHHRSPEALQAGNYLLKTQHSPGEVHFSYATFYGAQATFQLGDDYWGPYRLYLHRALFGAQQPDGSWDCDGDGGGPAYATAMAVLALTVEYRFLPIYQRGEPAGQK